MNKELFYKRLQLSILLS